MIYQIKNIPFKPSFNVQTSYLPMWSYLYFEHWNLIGARFITEITPSAQVRCDVVITGWQVLKGDKLKGARLHAIRVMTYVDTIYYGGQGWQMGILMIAPLQNKDVGNTPPHFLNLQSSPRKLRCIKKCRKVSIQPVVFAKVPNHHFFLFTVIWSQSTFNNTVFQLNLWN